MNRLFGALSLSLTLFALPAASFAACVTQVIQFNQTVNGTLATDDCVDHNANGKDYYYDYFEFVGTAGQQVAISNTSTTVDPDLLLVYPDNETVVYNDDAGGSTNARIPETGFFTLPASGKYHIAVSTAISLQTGSYTLTLTLNAPPPPPPPPPTGALKTFEFFNIDLQHFFVTAVPAEATAIDSGSAGPGWVRTGASYEVLGSAATSFLFSDLKALLAPSPVCRFYGTPGIGPNSHFYTADANECNIVKQDPGWKFEEISFYIQQPVFGSCPAGTLPIYRLYNNRAQFNDSNHRFVTSKQTFLAMGEQGWTMEGIVMCTTGVTAPVGVTGGTFKDASGAGIEVAPGKLPGYVNATAPSARPASSLPPGLTVNPNHGESNVTSGAPGYEVNLTGDSGFTTTSAGAVAITLPFNAAAVFAPDLSAPGKVQARILNPDDQSVVDLTGDVTTAGGSGMIKVETRGLPRRFFGSVIYNPNIEAATSDEATPQAIAPSSSADLKVDKVTWPAQSWCVLYNRANPNLIAAVKTVLGIAGNPTPHQIRSVIIDKVGRNAKTAQTIYENHGLNGPNLLIARTCGAGVDRYNIHMVDGGSFFQSDDPGEVVGSNGHHFGRLYIGNGRVDDSANTDLGTVLASVAHEMLHAIQNSYELLGSTPKGYKEGSAAVYGKTIDNGGVLKVRSETEMLSSSLMSPAAGEAYGNEDFFAYVARQYNAGSLDYLSGLFARMDSGIPANTYNPDASVMYNAMDAQFNAAFSQSLQTVYLDFLKQRALTHNATSQFGRAGEVVNGLARNLFGAGAISDQNVVLATCANQKISLSWPGVDSFAARVIVIKRTGADPPANSNGPTLQVKITPSSSSVGALWNGWVYRGGVATALAAVNKFANWGKTAPDEVSIVVANLDPASAGAFDFEISCGGLAIDSIAPVRGPVGTVVTINGSGFGTAADTRKVTFNGVQATTVNFASDTLATATVPQNASTGNVVVEVNGQASNGVPFEVVAQCSATQNAGGDTPDTRTIELGKPAGTFNFTYDTYFQQDRIIVRYQNSTLFDTGCVGASGTRALTYNGTSTSINVEVIPNCAGGTGTAWTYSVSCP